MRESASSHGSNLAPFICAMCTADFAMPGYHTTMNWKLEAMFRGKQIRCCSFDCLKEYAYRRRGLHLKLKERAEPTEESEQRAEEASLQCREVRDHHPGASFELPARRNERERAKKRRSVDKTQLRLAWLARTTSLNGEDDDLTRWVRPDECLSLIHI